MNGQKRWILKICHIFTFLVGISRIFSKIDSHDKAYFLGFLMADGYICTTPYNKQIGIGIQTKDKYIY